jgi:hypothetical protein
MVHKLSNKAKVIPPASAPVTYVHQEARVIEITACAIASFHLL